MLHLPLFSTWHSLLTHFHFCLNVILIMGCIIVCFFVLLFTPFSLHYVFAFDTILIVLGLKHSTHFFNDFRVIIEYLVFKRGPCGSLFLFGLASMVCAWYLSSSSLVVVNLCSITKKFFGPFTNSHTFCSFQGIFSNSQIFSIFCSLSSKSWCRVAGVHTKKNYNESKRCYYLLLFHL